MTSKKPSPPWLVELFHSLVPGPPVEKRGRSGSLAAFVNGHLFTGLSGSSLFLRLSQAAQAELLGLTGAQVFVPSPGHAMGEYVAVPPKMLEDHATLRRWIERAHEHARSLPPASAEKATRATAGGRAPRRSPPSRSRRP